MKLPYCGLLLVVGSWVTACAPQQPSGVPVDLPPVVAAESVPIPPDIQLDSASHRSVRGSLGMGLVWNRSGVDVRIPANVTAEVQANQIQELLVVADLSRLEVSRFETKLTSLQRARLASLLMGPDGLQVDQHPILWMRLSNLTRDTSQVAPQFPGLTKSLTYRTTGQLQIRGKRLQAAPEVRVYHSGEADIWMQLPTRWIGWKPVPHDAEALPDTLDLRISALRLEAIPGINSEPASATAPALPPQPNPSIVRPTAPVRRDSLPR